MTCIFYNPKTIFIGKFSKNFQIQRITCKINRNNTLISSFGSSFQHCFQLIDIHQVCILINITKYDITATITNTISTGCKGHGSYYHFIPRLYVQCRSCKVKSGSSIIHCYSKLCTNIFSKFYFKLFYFRTLSQIIRFQCLNNSLNIFIRNMLTPIRDRFIYHFTSKLESTNLLIFSRMDSTVSHSVLLSEL